MREHAVFRLGCCIALLLCLASTASAQTRIAGGISGNVADNTGGVQTAVYNKVAVESGRNTDLRVAMQPGDLSETIIVEGSAPVLETSNKRCIVKMGGGVV
jgi:hypothetical protein